MSHACVPFAWQISCSLAFPLSTNHKNSEPIEANTHRHPIPKTGPLDNAADEEELANSDLEIKEMKMG